MAQSDYEVAVRIESNSPSADDYGGEADSWTTHSSGYTPTKHFYSRQGLARFEGSAQAGGPGTLTALKVFFKFVQPFPSVNTTRPQDYRIVETVSGLIWPVQQIREYQTTMQFDCERVA